MKTKIISLLLILCLVISVMAINVSAADTYTYSISATTTTPTVGSEFDVTISLTNYAEMALGLRGIQIDVTGIDSNIFEIVSHSSLVNDSSAASNTTSLQNSSTAVRYVYLRLSGELDKSTTDLITFKLRVKDNLTESGTVTLPVTLLLSTSDSQKITLNDSLKIDYVADSSEEGNYQQDVNGKYVSGGALEIYSVNVSWGAMQFDYHQAEQEWNPDLHKWEAITAARWETVNNSNELTLANDSSAIVNASFSFNSIAQYGAVSGKFAYEGANLTAPLQLELPVANTPAKDYVVTFVPTGDIPDSHSNSTYAKIGAITITLG